MAALAAGAVLLSSCAGTPSLKPQYQFINDMRQQPKYLTQGESAFPEFTDGRSERRPVPGTIARGHLRLPDDPFYSGESNGMYIAENPLKITSDLLTLGQQRFDTYCAPCHSRSGNGKGIVAILTPSWIPADLVSSRIADYPDGEYFDIISNGRRTMPAYRFQIAEHDRWAIIAYLRALQRTTSATIDDVPQQLRTELR